ncbi:MAG: hypothetical protein QOJ54_3138 [Aliidongia sp.]|jgi:hypothetical protein|nr:hypothetical protein [Aliidongia sp.]
MNNGVAFLQDLHRLLSDDGFALSVLAVVGGAAILGFGFGATPEIVSAVLIVGLMTALAERKLRAKK